MSLADIQVFNIMSRVLVTVPENASLDEILDAMIKNKVSAVIVVAPSGDFIGIVTKTDIITALKEYGAEIFNKKAEDLLCPKPYTIKGTDTVREAARKMLNNKVHRLLVFSPAGVGKSMPVGVVSATDILKVVAL